MPDAKCNNHLHSSFWPDVSSETIIPRGLFGVFFDGDSIPQNFSLAYDPNPEASKEQWQVWGAAVGGCYPLLFKAFQLPALLSDLTSRSPAKSHVCWGKLDYSEQTCCLPSSQKRADLGEQNGAWRTKNATVMFLVHSLIPKSPGRSSIKQQSFQHGSASAARSLLGTARQAGSWARTLFICFLERTPADNTRVFSHAIPSWW